MKICAFLLFCVQACLIQNAYSACIGAYNGIGASGAYGLGAGVCGPNAGANGAANAYGIGAPGALAGLAGVAGAYGGEGVGDVAVIGELPVAGTTLVVGQVPILGAVRFAGDVPAAGSVSIAGSCGCGCNRAYI